MSFFNTPEDRVDAREEPRERKRRTTEGKRPTIAELGGRVARWFAGYDDEPDDQATVEYDSATDLDPGFPTAFEPSEPVRPVQGAQAVKGPEFPQGPPEPPHGFPQPSAREALQAPEQAPESDRAPSRFPLAPLGYNRLVVDEHLGELEAELEELRSREQPPMSISEELEKIGEQTASILVVAHDTARETTRQAQEQAERCIADAATNAVAITEEATRRLHQLDEETDLVWQERERLLEDVRGLSASLASLADQAAERFPAESKPPQAETRTPAMEPRTSL